VSCAQCNGHDPFFLSGDICKFRPYTIWVVQWRFGLVDLIPQTLYYLALYPSLAQNYGKEAHCRRTALKEGFSGLFGTKTGYKHYSTQFTYLYSYLTLYYSISCIKWENGDIYNTYVLFCLCWICAQCNGHDPFFLSGDICKLRPYTI